MINHLHTFEYTTKRTTDKRTYSRYNQRGATGGNWMNDRQTSGRLVFNIVDELHVIKNAGKWEKNLSLSLACFFSINLLFLCFNRTDFSVDIFF